MSDKNENSSRRAFVGHAKLIGVITFLSRIVGLLREMIAFRYFGDTGVWAAWKVAFTVPNLFRKLLGEGALSSAFVPLYAQAVQRDEKASSPSPDTANEFAAASVNLLGGILIVLTILGEFLLLALLQFFDWSPNNLLVLRFSVIMLPYVTLVCMTAFLGGILQVHHRFTVMTFTSVVLNVCLIGIIIAVAKTFDLSDREQQIAAARWLSVGVLVAGLVQLVMLIPSLRAAGFRFRLMYRIWTPAVKQMLLLTLPLATGAAVLQIGVMLDKGIAQLLASQPGHEQFTLAGKSISLPIAEGAAARLDLAQFMYQFPLGVFAIAIATAIFPMLAREATDPKGESFKRALREGIEASLWIGLPASAGMILVAEPAIRVLFEGGKFSSASAGWVAQSTAIYAGAIWAFSVLQIINRGFYSIHDSRTPLIWTAVNLGVNLAVEIPLLWTPLRESAMAVGTVVSFALQAIFMLHQLDRRLDGIGLTRTLPTIGKMILATAGMTGVCLLLKFSGILPTGQSKLAHATNLLAIMIVGGGVYVGVCAALKVDVMQDFLPRRFRRAQTM